MVDRLDRDRVDLALGPRLQGLHDLLVRLDRRLELVVELTDGAVVQRLQAGVDVVLVHVDQDSGPVGGGLEHLGLVAAFTGVRAMARPDHHREHDRGHREQAKGGRGDAVAGEDGPSSSCALLFVGAVVVGHGREGTWVKTGSSHSLVFGRPAGRHLASGRMSRVTVEAISSGIDLSHVDAASPPAGRPVRPRERPLAGRLHRSPPTGPPTARSGSLYDRAEEQIRDLITEAADAKRRRRAPTSSASATCTRASWMRPTVERIGVQPLLDELAKVDAADDARRVGRGPRRVAAHRGRRRHRRLHRHRLQGLHPLPAAPEPVRAGAARRVVLPRRPARRDPRRLSAPHRRDVRARVRRGVRAWRVAGHRRAHRRAGDQAGRRALGRRQTPRRRPHVQPAHVRRAARRGTRLRLGGLGHGDGYHA